MSRFTKILRFFCLFVVIVFRATLSSAWTLDECINEEQRNDPVLAKKWWDISSKTIEAFRENRIDDLASMISWPLVLGPNKSTLLSHPMSELFDVESRKNIEESDPICGHFNYMGSFIGNGEIWFSEMRDGSVMIISMPGIQKEFAKAK